MRIGIDIHGVISKHPKIFSSFCKLLLGKGHEVHILTGKEKTESLVKYLKDKEISYTSLFSITSYHKRIGTPMSYIGGDKSQPLIDQKLWDKTKAGYCKKRRLDLHIDDSPVYGRYFTGKTMYLYYSDSVMVALTAIIDQSM